MQNNVLVATPYFQFGELLRVSLEEDQLYRVSSAQTTSEALAILAATPLDLVILDGEFQVDAVRDFVSALRKLPTPPKLVLIPPENNPNHPIINEIQPDNWLSRPFYMPGMLKMVYQLLHPEDEAGEADEGLPQDGNPNLVPIPVSSRDSSPLEQFLENFIKENSARAALITRKGRLVSFSGRLTSEDARAINETLSKYWSSSSNYDLVRFARLSASGEEVLLYATPLEQDLGLGLVNSPLNPINKAREVILRLADEMKTRFIIEELDMDNLDMTAEEAGSAPAEKSSGAPSSPTEAVTPEVAFPKVQTLPVEVIRQVEHKLLRHTGEPPAGPSEPARDEPEELDFSLLFREPGEPLLPETDLPAGAYRPPLELTPANTEDESNLSTDWLDADEMEALEIPVLPSQQGAPASDALSEGLQPRIESIAREAPNELPEEREPAIPVDQPRLAPASARSEGDRELEEDSPVIFPWDEKDTLPTLTGNRADTRPILTSDTIPVAPCGGDTAPVRLFRGANSTIARSPSTAGAATRLIEEMGCPSTCLLLTRLPANRLRGELSRDLEAMLPEICADAGCRLEAMAIRPEYLQWTILPSPGMTPASLIRMVRQMTSDRILEKYPRMRPIDGSDDFWAPGYLALPGTRSPDPKTLYEFIRLTRWRQGYIRGSMD